MISLGVDLSSMPEGAAACRINWTTRNAVVEPPKIVCTDEDLSELILRSDVIGIDAPFGWPDAFVKAVANWTSKSWSKELRTELQYRQTDRFVHDKTEKWWPLSVSADRIALPAMRAMALLRRHGVTDKSGDGRFYEVYPAGSLKCWGLESRGYKSLKDEKCRGIRSNIIEILRRELPWLTLPEGYVESADALDALIASLTARPQSRERPMNQLSSK